VRRISMTVRRRSFVLFAQTSSRSGAAGRSSFIIRAARAVVFPFRSSIGRIFMTANDPLPGSDTVTILPRPSAFTSTAQPGGL